MVKSNEKYLSFGLGNSIPFRSIIIENNNNNPIEYAKLGISCNLYFLKVKESGFGFYIGLLYNYNQRDNKSEHFNIINGFTKISNNSQTGEYISSIEYNKSYYDFQALNFGLVYKLKFKNKMSIITNIGTGITLANYTKVVHNFNRLQLKDDTFFKWKSEYISKKTLTPNFNINLELNYFINTNTIIFLGVGSIIQKPNFRIKNNFYVDDFLSETSNENAKNKINFNRLILNFGLKYTLL